jgi:hypothetical protein
VIEILFDQIKSMAPRVTLFALRILRYLSMDIRNLERLQEGKHLRLTGQLIYTFNWLFSKNNHREQMLEKAARLSCENSSLDVSVETDDEGVPDNIDMNSPEYMIIQESNLIYREIGKTFSYMLLHYDILQKFIHQNEEELKNQENNENKGQPA